MPSITTYSPYETLAFFQSVAKHGSDASALQDVSTALRQNELIHNGTSLDDQRFSVGSLRRLYEEHVLNGNARQSAGVNGDLNTGERSPKRRKLSASPRPSEDALSEDERSLQILVDRLYANFKEDIAKQIRKDEEIWQGLQEEITSLEKQLNREQELQRSNNTTDSATTGVPAKVLAIDDDESKDKKGTESTKGPLPPTVEDSTLSSSDIKPKTNQETQNNNRSDLPRYDHRSPPAGDSVPSRPNSSTQFSRTSQAPPAIPGQGQSPGGFPRQMPSPAPQRPNYTPMQAQPAYPSAQTPPTHMVPPITTAQPRPHARIHQSGNQGQIQSQGRGSPIPYQGQHPYGPYAQFQPPPPPQWHPHMPAQQYPQHTPYAAHPPYYPQPSNGRHPQTPQPLPYPPYPHTAPVPYMQQQQWRGQQWPVQSASAMTTPVSRPNSRISLPGSGSSTPWKKRQQASNLRNKSPARPEREVSPLTDREDTPAPGPPSQSTKKDASRKGRDETPSQKPTRRRGRPSSVTPSVAAPSRSQSAASRNSEGRNERQTMSRRSRKIKAEPPSTPLPVPSSDTEQRSSGRRGRPRSSTVTSQADGRRPMTMKRKRDTISPTPSLRSSQPPPAAASRNASQTYDPSLVTVSKNFAKTSQLLLSEITSHKLAGIFAKPLSERDAPGYKDFVLRPQDLKSIKAAVSKGSRAALVAIEVLEGDNDATPTKSQTTSSTAIGAGAIGNGFYLVPKTADLVPPKGIVNSSQLEMELVRMFANAVMFNPLPSSERGFGKALRLRRNGGDVDVHTNKEAVSVSDGSEGGSLDGNDEGGIISDAREMFNDVVEMVGKWRDLEVERMGQHTDGTMSRHGSLAVPVSQQAESGRHNSVSASSNIGDDEATVAESESANTPVPATSSGPGRKRRRIVEH